MSDERVRCERCGDVIGVYEPIVLLVDGEPLVSSRAALRCAAVDGPRFHRDCYALRPCADESQCVASLRAVSA
jgi:hypothetical protein